MAKSGLSKMYYGKYAYNTSTGVVSYNGSGFLAKAVEVSIDPDDNGGTKFYADNGVAEVANNFGSGTVTFTVDRLTPVVKADIFGATLGNDSKTVTYAADDVAPYIGLGFIVRLQRDQTLVYMPVFLPKVVMHRPGDSATSQGETVEFSGEELTGDILRSDEAGGAWKETTECADEAAAITWLSGKLGIT